MKYKQGKFNLGTIIILLLIIYGCFIAFQFITVRITKGQIKNEVINQFGYIRGPDFSEEQGVKVILKILEGNGVIPPVTKREDEGEGYYGGDEQIGDQGEITVSRKEKKLKVSVSLDDRKRNINFFITYEQEIDLVLFKTSQVFEIRDQVRNYN